MGGLGGGQDGDLDGAAQEEGVLGARAVELEDAADGRVVAHGEREQRGARGAELRAQRAERLRGGVEAARVEGLQRVVEQRALRRRERCGLFWLWLCGGRCVGKRVVFGRGSSGTSGLGG